IQAQYPPAGGGSCSVSHERLLGAIVAIDPTNGEIISAVGSGGGPKGVNYAKFALNAEGSPASSIKPMWLLLNLDNHQTGSASPITSATVLPTKRGPERIRTALAWSSDDLPRFLMDTIGADKAATFFEALTGKHAEASPEMLALGFGTNTEVGPLTWARA